MSPMDLYSEPFQPTGSIASEGVRNVLGRPAMDLLTLLVRESAQNSWDARAREDGPVEFRLDGWELTAEQARLARDEIFPQQPPNIALDELMEPTERPRVLMVSDRGTAGLGGPLRADEVRGDHAPRDFVDFLRNVGQPPDKRFGGGTFGYGKSVLYNASLAQTILVYTRCRAGAGHESRLIGAALGGQYHAEFDGQLRPFTGRHWWGRMVNGVIDPLLDQEADELADGLGFPVMHGDETGTSILILGPRFEEREPVEAMSYLGEALLWHFWPKMVQTPARPIGLRSGISWQGDEIALPSPESHPRLSGFVAALRSADDSHGDRIGVSIQRPQRHLGWMAFHRFAVVDHDPDRRGADAAPIGPAVHHVALMRSPRNVVRYVEGPPLPHEVAGYAAVFIADDDVDRAFAEAEPPSHDDWLPEVLERGHNKRFVNVALRNIRQELQNHAAPPNPARATQTTPPLGAISHQLASLIPWEEGPGAALPVGSSRAGANATGDRAQVAASPVAPSGAGGTSARISRARVSMAEPPRLGLEDGRPVVLLRFSVQPAAGTSATAVTLQAGVAVQDGEAIESDPPEGANRPRLLRWEGAEGDRHEGDEILRVPAESQAVWTAVVSTDARTAVGLTLAAEAVRT